MYEHLHKVKEILKNKQNDDKKSRKSWYYKQYKLFYVKQGFDKYEKTVKKFGKDNYDEKIRNENAICIDKYYYSKKLNKKQ